MERPATPAQIVSALLGAVSTAEQFRGDLAQWITAIPIPAWSAARLLTSSLLRVSSNVSWLAPSLPEALKIGRLAELQSTLSSDSRFHTPEEAGLTNLLRRYSVLGALIDARPKPPPYLEELRAVSILAAFTWQPDALESVQAVLAMAIRAINKKLAHPLRLPLLRIGRTDSALQLGLALESALSEIRTSNGDLADGLQRHFIGLLKEAGKAPRAKSAPPLVIVTDPPAPNPIAPAPTGNPPARPPVVPAIKKVRRVRRRPTSRRLSMPGAEPPVDGESMDETCPARVFTSFDSAPGKKLKLRAALRKARQSIWGKSEPIIREHIESLTDFEAIAFAADLSVQISLDLECGRHDEVALGLLVGLAFVSGAGPDRLRVVRFTKLSGAPSMRLRPSMCIDSGVLRIPVLRPQSAFHPTAEQAPSLQSVARSIDLPIPPKLVGLMKQAAQAELSFALPKSADGFKSALERYVRGMAKPLSGPSVTFSRCRLTARARIQEHRQDLAATMLLCGDDFGSSDALLYYACFPAGVLQVIFQQAVWPLFGDTPDPTHGADKNFVGSELMVPTSVSRDLAHVIGGALHRPNRKAGGALALAVDHNRLVDHVAAMEMVVGSHRPSNALFRLGRYDFDTKGHCSVLSDKQSDVAHLTRFSPCAEILSTQIERLLTHYRALRKRDELIRIPNTLRAIDLALSGEGPLLFHLDESMEPSLLKMDSWKDSLPKPWRTLPLNWGRTFFASHGRAAGIPADHLAIYQGHLEATGYPFSRESPTEPAQLAIGMSPQLDLVARNGGWVARNGLTCPSDASAELVELGPLLDWNDQCRRHAERCKEFEVDQRNSARSQLRGHRERGELVALDALSNELGADLVGDLEASISDRRQPKQAGLKEQPSYDLDKLDLIQRAIDDATSDQPVLRLAAHNALHRLLKHAKKHLRWAFPVPGPLLAGASLEPTPFFPGMMRARMQTHALRESYRCIPKRPPAGSGFSAFEWSVGTATLSVCVYGFIEQPTTLLAVLGARTSAFRSKTFGDLLLVPWQDQPQRIAGLRRLAAVAVARLARDWPTEALPSKARIGEVLAKMLPAPLAGNEHADLLDRLCATVSINNRIELSGLARFTLDADNGSTDLTPARLRQLTEEGAGFEATAPVDLPDGGATRPAELELPRRKRGQSYADTQYAELSRTLFIGEGPTTLKRTGKLLSGANIGAFRNSLELELEAFLKQDGLSPLVAALAAFALNLTRDGTPKELEPAWSTVHTYVISFGRTLVDIAGSLAFLELEEDDYADIYLELMETCGSRKNGWVAARELANFHRYLVKHHDVRPIDLSEITKLVGGRMDRVDAEVIQAREFTNARASIATGLAADAGPEFNAATHRLNRQSLVLMILIRGSGGRINEIAGLRFKDLIATHDATILFIRPSRYRRLKTSAARRLVNLTPRLDAADRLFVSQWVTAERERLQGRCKPTALVFGQLEDPKQRLSAGEMRNVIQAALGTAALPKTRVHRFRHLVANEELLGLWFCDSDWDAWCRTRTSSPHRTGRRARPSIVLPRHLRAFTAGFGHRRSTTTATSYFHAAWSCTSRPASALQLYEDRHNGAIALAMLPTGADKIVQRAKRVLVDGEGASGKSVAWLHHLAGPATDTPGEAPRVRFPDRAGIQSLSGRLVEQVLRDIQRSSRPESVCISHGLTAGQAEALRKAARAVELRTGFTFWPGEDAGSRRRTVRRFTVPLGSSGLPGLLEVLDGPDTNPARARLISLASSYLSWASKGRRETFLWPRRDTEELQDFLIQMGVPPARILLLGSDEEADLVTIRLLRDLKGKLLLNHSLAWLLMVTRITVAVSAKP